jgi:ABC-type glycerol-3-phosphate transport system permease component
MSAIRKTSRLPGVVAGLAALVMFFPIAWMFLGSLKTEVDAVSMPPSLIFAPTLENYQAVFQHADYALVRIEQCYRIVRLHHFGTRVGGAGRVRNGVLSNAAYKRHAALDAVD